MSAKALAQSPSALKGGVMRAVKPDAYHKALVRGRARCAWVRCAAVGRRAEGYHRRLRGDGEHRRRQGPRRRGELRRAVGGRRRRLNSGSTGTPISDIAAVLEIKKDW